MSGRLREVAGKVGTVLLWLFVVYLAIGLVYGCVTEHWYQYDY